MTDFLNQSIDVVPKTEVDELTKAVRGLLSDIESMQTKAWNSYADPEGWFGPFSDACEDMNGNTQIQWPNLAISAEAVKKLLEPKTIEGELSATKAIT